MVGRCVASVMAGTPADATGLRLAETPFADAVREARGGEVWRSTFGGVLMHQATASACEVIVPGADPRGFAFWLERWSNGREGRMWGGKWFGRLDTTAWRRLRRRGGGDVRIQAVTGGDRAASEVRVRRGYGGR